MSMGYGGMEIRRVPHYQSVTIASSAAESDAFHVGRDACLVIKVPSAWTAADIGFLACEEQDGTFVDVEDSSGARIKVTGITTDASKWYDVPETVAKHVWLKIESLDTSDETAENQGAERTLVVLKKS